MSDDRRSLNSIDDIEFAVRRIEELEAKLAAKEKLTLALVGDKIDLVSELAWVKGKLEKAVEALGEAVYLLDPDEKDMARKAGVYRVVTTLAELKGQEDD